MEGYAGWTTEKAVVSRRTFSEWIPPRETFREVRVRDKGGLWTWVEVGHWEPGYVRRLERPEVILKVRFYRRASEGEFDAMDVLKHARMEDAQVRFAPRVEALLGPRS